MTCCSPLTLRHGARKSVSTVVIAQQFFMASVRLPDGQVTLRPWANVRSGFVTIKSPVELAQFFDDVRSGQHMAGLRRTVMIFRLFGAFWLLLALGKFRSDTALGGLYCRTVRMKKLDEFDPAVALEAWRTEDDVTRRTEIADSYNMWARSAEFYAAFADGPPVARLYRDSYVVFGEPIQQILRSTLR
jgi:hypothetical protein